MGLSKRESGWQSEEERMVLQQRDQQVQRPRGRRETNTVRKLLAVWLSQVEMFGRLEGWTRAKSGAGSRPATPGKQWDILNAPDANF